MKKLFWASVALICCELASLLVSSAWMVSFVQWDARMAAVRHAPGVHLLYENVVHANGFAQIAIGVLGLLIVFIPYRRRERWAWLALAIILGVYCVPVYVLPFPSPSWAGIAEAVRQPGPSRTVLLTLLFPTLMLLGLLLSLPAFVRQRGTSGCGPR